MVSKYPTLHLCVLYARARQTRIAVMGEEVAHLSDTLRIGQRVTKREKGKRWTCEGCQEQVKWAPLAEGGSGWRHLAENGKAIGKEGLCKGEKPRKEIIYETETVTADMIDRSRLQVDSRKWLLARLAAKIYGEKLQLASDPDSPLTVKHGLDLMTAMCSRKGRRLGITFNSMALSIRKTGHRRLRVRRVRCFRQRRAYPADMNERLGPSGLFYLQT